MSAKALSDLNPPPRILLGAGPSNVHPRVYQAMMAPILGHLDPDFLHIMDETKSLLRAVFRTQSEDAGFNRKRSIAVGLGADGGERILRTTGGPSCIAKNRYGLPAELPLSWAALVEAVVQNTQDEGDEANG